MALPVVSRPRKSVREYKGIYCTKYVEATRTAQRRPYNIVLPYAAEMFESSASQYSGPDWGSPLEASAWTNFYDERIWTNLDNEAFEKLKGKVYSGMQLANDVLEGGQTFKMMSQAGKTLIDAFRALKRGDLRSLKRLLRLKKDVQFSHFARDLGSKWLELHFGWQPLLETIYQGLELYASSPPVFQKFSAKAVRPVDSFTFDPNAGSGYWTQRKTVTSTYTVKTGLLVRAVKDSSFTLEQLGLMNPAAIAWEAVPYSFFVDYILNVGDVLASYTAFSGLDIEGTYTTHFFRLYVQIFNLRKDGVTALPEYKDLVSSLSGVYVTRSAVLPAVTLGVRSFKVPSKTRLATVGSLLTQFFRK